MREIKFRAWNKENEKMIYSNETYPRSIYKFEFDIVSNFNFKLTKMVDRFNVKDDDGEDYYIECYEPIDADIMQYTGLKDKNGKEIYEGDIIQDCEGNVMKVIWFDNGFMLEFRFKRKFEGEFYIDKTNLKLSQTDDRRWGMQVIGNIYENPELLG